VTLGQDLFWQLIEMRSKAHPDLPEGKAIKHTNLIAQHQTLTQAGLVRWWLPLSGEVGRGPFPSGGFRWADGLSPFYLFPAYLFLIQHDSPLSEKEP
jgi:hypothetical protein